MKLVKLDQEKDDYVIRVCEGTRHDAKAIEAVWEVGVEMDLNLQTRDLLLFCLYSSFKAL